MSTLKKDVQTGRCVYIDVIVNNQDEENGIEIVQTVATAGEILSYIKEGFYPIFRVADPFDVLTGYVILDVSRFNFTESVSGLFDFVYALNGGNIIHRLTCFDLDLPIGVEPEVDNSDDNPGEGDDDSNPK